MKKITFLAAFLSLYCFSFGQSYYYLPGTGTSQDYYEGLADSYTTVMTADRADPSSEINDVMSAAQTIPFAFDFFGTNFTQYKLSDNGYITFDVAATTSNNRNTALPSDSAPANAIMAFWDDLEFEQYQTFLFAAVSTTQGTAPNRTHVIKWFQANHTGRAAEISELITFGIVLHEQGGFEIVHENQYTNTTAYTETATIGINNDDGTEGITVEGPSAAFPNLDGSSANFKVYSFFPGIQSAKDVGIVSVDMVKETLIGSVPTVTTIRNYGSETVTSIDLSYTVDGGAAVTDNFTTSIAPGAAKTFTHTTAWNASAAGNYNIAVSFSNPNNSADENPDNDNLQTFAVDVFSSAPARIPLYEVFTSSTCGPCTPGNENFHSIIDGARSENCTYIKYQQNFPGTGDPYASSQSVGRRGYYAVNSIPRMEIDGEWDGNANSFTVALHDEATSSFCLVELSASFDKWGQSVVTTVNLDAIKDLSNVSIYAAVIETLNVENIKSNGETEFINVFKRFMTSANGDLINITSGTPTSKSYQVDFKGDYKLASNGSSTSWININSNHDVEDFENLKVLVWVQDNATKKVLQSAYAQEINLGVNDVSSTLNAGVSPNPTTGLAKVSLDLLRNSSVNVTLTNSMGQVVNTYIYENVNAGNNSLNLNLSDYAEGVYFFNIITNEGSTTKKVILSK